jgi:hypothetical protein
VVTSAKVRGGCSAREDLELRNAANLSTYGKESIANRMVSESLRRTGRDRLPYSRCPLLAVTSSFMLRANW